MATDTTASTSSAPATDRSPASRWRRAWAIALAAIAGCAGPPAVTGHDAGPSAQLGTVDNIVAFEGQHAFVTLVHAPVDLTGARLTLPPELDVRELRCVGSMCAIVAEVLDTTPSTGTPVPPPIDAMVRQIVLETDADRVTATVSVVPLDRIESSGGVGSVQGTYFASSVDAPMANFVGVSGGQPIRWLVFGDVLLHGTVDVSGAGSVAGCGGLDGAPIGAAATGEGAGGDGAGGGSAIAGIGPGATAGGAAWAIGCASDFFARECGGGGGGGDAATAGGGGGGAFALVSLGRVAFEGSVDAHGSDGAGGGGGGRAIVSGIALDTAPVVDVGGGSGTDDANGGAGEVAAGLETSLGLDLDHPSFILDTPDYALDGQAPAGAVLRAETVDGVDLGSATAGSDGAFHLAMTLPAGFSRVRVYVTEADGMERRAFVGNHVELERRGIILGPVGGLIDLVVLPEAP